LGLATGLVAWLAAGGYSAEADRLAPAEARLTALRPAPHKPAPTHPLILTDLVAAPIFPMTVGPGAVSEPAVRLDGVSVSPHRRAALLAIVLANKDIPIPYLYSIWLAPTILQGSMDPTNSWTLWTIGYTKVSHGQFLRTALPFGCVMVAINSLICYLMLGSLQ